MSLANLPDSPSNRKVSTMSTLFARIRNRRKPSRLTVDSLDLADKPLTYPPLLGGLAIQMAQQDGERDWSAGAHDVPSILNGSINQRLEAYRRLAARLRSESRQRHTLAKLANRINGARIVTGDDAAAPKPGEGLTALKLHRHSSIAALKAAQERVAVAKDRILGVEAHVPSGFGWSTLARLALLGFAFSIVLAGAELFVLQAVMTFLTRTPNVMEALAWAVMPVLFMVAAPKVAGAGQRRLDHADAPARDPRRRVPTFLLLLASITSLAMAVVRAFAAMAERERNVVEQAAKAISSVGAAPVSVWETRGLILGFVMLALAFLGAVQILYFQARRSPIDDQIAYILAVRSCTKAGTVCEAAVQDVAKVEEHLRVNDADLEITDEAFVEERVAGVEALVKNMAGTYLVEIANQSGDPRITDALMTWTDERVDAMEGEAEDGDAA